MNNTKNLHPSGRDYIIKQLLEYGWRRVFIILGIVYIFSLLPIIISFFKGDFSNNELKIDALRDFSYHAMNLLLLPFFLVFIPYYLNGLEKAINSLLESNVLRLNEEDYRKAISYSNNLFANRMVTIFPYILTILLSVFSAITINLAGLNTWNSSGLQNITLTSLLSIFNGILFYFFFFALIIRIALTYFVINKFLDGHVDVQPLHPDNCGGLSPLSKFALRVSWAGIGIGIPVVILIYSNYYNKIPQFELYNIMNIGTYIISLTIVFFLPLLGARKSMLRAKNEQLKAISDHFQAENKEILEKINNQSLVKNLETSDLEALMKLYNIAKAMPVFPFNSKNIVRFLSSVLWPVVLFLLEYISGKF